jgi:hypothetical protein
MNISIYANVIYVSLLQYSMRWCHPSNACPAPNIRLSRPKPVAPTYNVIAHFAPTIISVLGEVAGYITARRPDANTSSSMADNIMDGLTPAGPSDASWNRNKLKLKLK